MKQIKKALGKDIYLYGEGWHFGEMTKPNIQNARQELLLIPILEVLTTATGI